MGKQDDHIKCTLDSSDSYPKCLIAEQKKEFHFYTYFGKDATKLGV